MCGIVGYVGDKNALQVVLAGLQKLEYRGYDSAGVAMSVGATVEVRRAVGKLSQLESSLEKTPLKGIPHLGIGHTRWATHGKPTEDNAHPHTAGRISLIHNGIIENYLELKKELMREGAVFKSETDTECAAHLLDHYLKSAASPFAALQETCKRIRGSYSFLAIDATSADRILVAKTATPIIIGVGEGENFVASDIPAVLPYTRKVIILEDGDIAEISKDHIYIENNGQVVSRTPQTITWDPVTAQKGGFKHYMLKEIHDQVSVSADTFRGRVDRETGNIELSEITFSDADVQSIRRIIFVACGTAWHAALVGKFYFEKFAALPCEVDYASEFRYRDLSLDKHTLVIAVSQSGETADTLAAIDVAQQHGAPVLAICNVLGSTLARKVQNTIFTHAGPEISVASTKAFTTQLITLLLLALKVGLIRGVTNLEQSKHEIDALTKLPTALEAILKQSKLLEKLSKQHHRARDFLFLGRGICFPIALEGALKLKEISYIHAEGYPAGEIKHGPLALIDEDMPVVMVLNQSAILEKTVSNLKEVESRGAKLLCITDTSLADGMISNRDGLVTVPFISEALAPVLLNIPLQLLAYFVAVHNGTDVDLPRNLAKSVTVE
jgi:glucosamine--fructose-6-phosphate aminotransferase (isomerizing)